MRAPNQNEFDTNSSPSPRLTDDEFIAEAKAHHFVRKMALVQIDKPPRSSSAEKIAERRQKQADAEKRGQFNFTTTLDPEKRELIKKFADAISPVNSTFSTAAQALFEHPAVVDLMLAIAERPELLEDIDRALADAANAARGRRTAAPDVAAAVDAILADETLRRLVLLLADAEPGVAELALAIAADPEIIEMSSLLVNDAILRKLLGLLATKPALTALIIRTAQDRKAGEFLKNAWDADKDTQQNLIDALAKPELLRLLTAAHKSRRDIAAALRLTIDEPDTPGLGRAVKNMTGVVGFLVRWWVAHSRKQQRQNS